MLVLVCGLPGTGKSTLSKNLAREIKATVLRTDVVRKELFSSPTYTDEEKRLIYDVIFLVAKYLLLAKRNVIMDGTFYRRTLRREVYNIAERTYSKLHVIECICPEDVIKQRMLRRSKRSRGLSDADFEVYKKIEKVFEPIERGHIKIDTSRSQRESLKDALKAIKTV